MKEQYFQCKSKIEYIHVLDKVRQNIRTTKLFKEKLRHNYYYSRLLMIKCA